MKFRWDAKTTAQFETAIADYRTLIDVVVISLTATLVIAVYLTYSAFTNQLGAVWWLFILVWVIEVVLSVHLYRITKHRRKLIRMLIENSMLPRRQPGQAQPYETIIVGGGQQSSNGNHDCSSQQRQPTG